MYQTVALVCVEVLGRVLPSVQQALFLAQVLVFIMVLNLSLRPMRERLPMYMGFLSQATLIATILAGLIYERAVGFGKANKVRWMDCMGTAHVGGMCACENRSSCVRTCGTLRRGAHREARRGRSVSVRPRRPHVPHLGRCTRLGGGGA